MSVVVQHASLHPIVQNKIGPVSLRSALRWDGSVNDGQASVKLTLKGDEREGQIIARLLRKDTDGKSGSATPPPGIMHHAKYALLFWAHELGLVSDAFLSQEEAKWELFSSALVFTQQGKNVVVDLINQVDPVKKEAAMKAGWAKQHGKE